MNPYRKLKLILSWTFRQCIAEDWRKQRRDYTLQMSPLQFFYGCNLTLFNTKFSYPIKLIETLPIHCLPCKGTGRVANGIEISRKWAKGERLPNSTYNGACKNMAMNDTTTAKRYTQMQMWFSTKAAFRHSSCLASSIIWYWTFSARILLELLLSLSTLPLPFSLIGWILADVSFVVLSFTERSNWQWRVKA